MKVLVITLIAISLIACKKNSDKTCWHCDCSVPATGQTFSRDTCRNDNVTPQFKDAAGNDANCICNQQ